MEPHTTRLERGGHVPVLTMATTYSKDWKVDDAQASSRKLCFVQMTHRLHCFNLE